MPTLAERWKSIWTTIQHGATQLPSPVAILPDHVAQQGQAGAAFKRDAHYFQVRLNEMYLANSREWFVKYNPMVFVVSEFIYDKKQETVPFLVGPMLLENGGQKLPDGMVFYDTRVAGIHPYRGGRLTLSIVLYRTQNENFARNFLKLVEGAASALDFSTALGAYTKVAGVVLDGFESLLGLDKTVPIVGFRKEFDSTDGFAPGFIALIDAPDINPQELWVRERRLFHGETAGSAQPFRSADFVLYSIVQPADNRRDDISTLPFYPLWERVEREANTAKDDHWTSAKANMASLVESMVLSPDLTPAHADELADSCTARMQTLHQRAVDRSKLDEAAGATPDELGAARVKVVSILEM